MEKVDLELMKDVAKRLGFKVEPMEDPQDTWRVFLVNGEEKLFVNCTWASKGKYYLNGCYPEDSRGNAVTPYVQVEKTRSDGEKYPSMDAMPKPDIAFNPLKGAEKVAADISRRFLPAYRAYLAQVQKKIKETNEYYAKMDAGLEKVCKALGEKIPGEGKDRVYVGNYGVGFIGELRIQGSGETARFELECPVDLAVKIFRMLK